MKRLGLKELGVLLTMDEVLSQNSYWTLLSVFCDSSPGSFPGATYFVSPPPSIIIVTVIGRKERVFNDES